MIRIFLVDDHQMVIDGISSILADVEEVKVVGTASNGKEALEKIAVDAHDLILLDINMPEMDGIEVVNHLRENGDHTKVLILTMHNNAQFTKQLSALGVNGCILKNTGKSELLNAIKTIYQGEKYYGKAVTDNLLSSMEKTEKAVNKVKLTKREVQIVKLIANEMTTNEIADELSISTLTVETHRKNIVSKLKVKNAAGLVRFAFENGLV